MSKPIFVIAVADLERGAKSVTWPIPVAWLAEVLKDTEATPDGEGVLEVELGKNGNEVLVRGRARVSVHMPCVVTLEPLPFELAPDVFLLLSPAPASVATPARGGRAAKRRPEAPVKARSRGKNEQHAWDEAPELNEKDAARDFFVGDKVVLDGFLREFILLELPMYPRRSDLPPEQTPARATPPLPEASEPQPVDPRLLPLAELRDRLRQIKKE